MNNAELLRLTLPMDIFFTSGNSANPWTLLNRITGAGLRRAYDRDVPTHTGFITHDSGQVFCTELTEDGIEEDSLQKYLRGKQQERIVAIYRWDGFANVDLRDHAVARLAYLRQLDHGYDWRGAIGLAWRWMRGSGQREYCSENVFTMLRKYGWRKYPAAWDKRAPHPWPLMCAMLTDGVTPGEFALVKRFHYR